MAPNKAPGIDKIPMRIIRYCLQAISYPLTSIINTSLLSACFPNAWKIAEMKPIPKEGDHEMANDTRPISLLPVLSRVCERVAHNQFMEYLTSKGRLSTKTSGNKEKHSTETSVIKTTDMILSAIDKRHQMKNDPRSCDRNFYNCVKKPEKKFRTSTGLEPVTSRIPVRRSTN